MFLITAHNVVLCEVGIEYNVNPVLPPERQLSFIPLQTL